jgi:hypothetical protein
MKLDFSYNIYRKRISKESLKKYPLVLITQLTERLLLYFIHTKMEKENKAKILQRKADRLTTNMNIICITLLIKRYEASRNKSTLEIMGIKTKASSTIL